MGFLCRVLPAEERDLLRRVFSPTVIASRFVPPNTGALPTFTPVWPNLCALGGEGKVGT